MSISGVNIGDELVSPAGAYWDITSIDFSADEITIRNGSKHMTDSRISFITTGWTHIKSQLAASQQNGSNPKPATNGSYPIGHNNQQSQGSYSNQQPQQGQQAPQQHIQPSQINNIVPPPKFNLGDELEDVITGYKYKITRENGFNYSIFEYTYDVLGLTSGFSNTGITESTLRNCKVISYALGMMGLKAIIAAADVAKKAVSQDPYPKTINCRIVEAQACGKSYFYCREHDEEADHMTHCRKKP